MPEMAASLRSVDALIIVDLQRDFCPGGALAVPEGDRVVPWANREAARFAEAGGLVVATRDWHPSDHESFQSQSGPWPVHCVRESDGAAFHPDLVLPEGTVVIDKGVDRRGAGYSGFEGTDLLDRLRDRGIARVRILGLALEVCVLATALDARRAGLDVVVDLEGIRAIAVDGRQRALDELAEAGVVILGDVSMSGGRS